VAHKGLYRLRVNVWVLAKPGSEGMAQGVAVHHAASGVPLADTSGLKVTV